MTFRDDLRGLAESVRGMAADFGVRSYSLTVRTTTWSGGQPGHGTATNTDTAITESGSNPKVAFVQTDEIFSNDGAIEVAEVGPITPDHPTGGTAISTLRPVVADGDGVTYILAGPRYPNGAEFELEQLKHHRGYQYSLVLRRSA